MKFNTKYKYDKVKGIHFNKPSLTDQSQAFDADINNIINGMGICPQTAQPPIFNSEFNPNMYNDALNTVATAKSEFEKLPSNIRREFNNDIQQFVQFMDNPNEENAKKGVKLGLFKKDILDSFKVSEPVLKDVLPTSGTPEVTNPVGE